MRMSVDITRCVACSICELACSFHHTKEFLPENASIRICLAEKGHLDFVFSSTCDFCSNEEIPLCMEFCPSKAIIVTGKKLSSYASKKPTHEDISIR
jgi:Fe-S-cluster-containing dehydrogenase component